MNNWIPILNNFGKKNLPENGRKVLVSFKAFNNDRRRCLIAFHTKKFEIEENTINVTPEDLEYWEEAKGWYLDEGWYECFANCDESDAVFINRGSVTHWMPLPKSPMEKTG